jgi:transmembrane 9 superfamily protein 3
MACAAVVATYFRLNAENYEWQLSSFAGPFGISIYILAYAAYFYRNFYEYAGPLQLVAFMMSSTALAVVIGTVCGFVGFIAVAGFINFVFKNQKTD